jgi:hypothetical protein
MEPHAERAGGVVDTPPVFLRLARTLDLAFQYELYSPRTVVAKGSAGVEFHIDASDVWTKRVVLLEDVPFTGPSVSQEVTIDLRDVAHLLTTIEEETGYQPGKYTLSVIPRVDIHGRAGSHTLDEEFAPVFSMELDRTRLVLDEDLTRVERVALDVTTAERNEISLLGAKVPVGATRWVSTTAGAMALVGTVILSLVMFLGVGRDEAARIHSRYGAQILTIANGTLPEAHSTLEMSSMRDLMLLAQQEGRSVFHLKEEPGIHVYFLYDNEHMYRYSVREASARQERRFE